MEEGRGKEHLQQRSSWGGLVGRELGQGRPGRNGVGREKGPERTGRR